MVPSNTPEADVAEAELDEKPVKLNLDVKIDTRGACERHVTVSVPRSDIERYYDKTFSDMMGTAQVPGFRSGHVPRKLIERKFRKEVADQIKSSIIVDSLTQVSEDNQLAAISEPDLDVTSVVLPDDGPMTFEFNIEVRPEFDLPEWKGLEIERPVREFNDADVAARLKSFLEERAELATVDGPAAAGDSIDAKFTATLPDGSEHEWSGEQVSLKPTLRFNDGDLEGFDKLMTGAKAGDVKTGKVKIAAGSSNEELRGKEIPVKIEVTAVKRYNVAPLTPEAISELGFPGEEELKGAVKDSMQRQLDYQQQQRMRQQVLGTLTKSADWELPPDMLRRQAERELERSVLELQRSGFSEREIRAHESQLRQNSLVETKRALKEHFVLERIAEDQKITDTNADYDLEIALIAAQSGQSTRKIRAQLEKRNLMDSLRNQIIERKVLAMVREHAKFKDIPYEMPTDNKYEAVDWAVGSKAADAGGIPVATNAVGESKV